MTIKKILAVLMVVIFIATCSPVFAKSRYRSGATYASDGLTDWIRTYSNQGNHRSGSEEDQKSALWLKNILQANHIPVTLESFAFNRPVNSKGILVLHVEPHVKEFTGMPLLNAKATGNEGYSSRLGTIHENRYTPVLYRFDMMPNEEASNEFLKENHRELEDVLSSDRYPAVIIITQGNFAGLAPFNINLERSYHKPVLLVSSNSGDELEMYTHVNMNYDLVTVVKHESTTAYNVVAKIEGTQPRLKPLVVMVDRSAWWRGAGEHGTGVATWIYTAKRLRQQNLMRTVYLIALTGHELGDLGLKEFLKIHPELAQDAYAWIKIGDNIAAATQIQYALYTNQPGFAKLAAQNMLQHQMELLQTFPTNILESPTLLTLQQNENKFLIFEGLNNNCFHLECDRWPAAINIKEEIKFSQAFSAWMAELSRDT